MKASEFTTEDNFGTHPKRPARTGSRHPRGHQPVPRYKTITAQDSDNTAESVAEGSKEKTQGIALSKAYKKDFDDKKPGHDRAETALTGTYSKTGKPGGELKKQGVAGGSRDRRDPYDRGYHDGQRMGSNSYHNPYSREDEPTEWDEYKSGFNMAQIELQNDLEDNNFSEGVAETSISTQVSLPKWQIGLTVFVKHLGQKGEIASLGNDSAIVDVGMRQYRVPLNGLKRYPSQGVAEGLVQEEKIGGRYDADEFDDMVSRLKNLAGAGPMRTVYDPDRRVYRNMPTAQQPAPQPKKAPR
jgi:hypothetical protein